MVIDANNELFNAIAFLIRATHVLALGGDKLLRLLIKLVVYICRYDEVDGIVATSWTDFQLVEVVDHSNSAVVVQRMLRGDSGLNTCTEYTCRIQNHCVD